MSIDFSSVELLMHNLDEMLVLQTYEYEQAILKENMAREAKVEAANELEGEFNKTFLRVLHGDLKTDAGKPFAQSVAKDVAKAMCSELRQEYAMAESTHETMMSLARIEMEKMNAIKKLIEARSRLGG